MRKPDGQVYGPVDEVVIRSWAEAGRVAPDDHISRDLEHWSPAPAFVELELCWMIEGSGGERYGPVHIEACRILAREGQLGPDSIACNTITGERQVLADTDTPQAETAPDPSVEDTSELPPAWTVMARERDHSVDEARRWKTLYEEERRSSAEAGAAAQERIRALEQEVIRLQGARDQAEIECRRLRRMREGPGENPNASEAVLTEIHQELTLRFDALSRKYEDKVAEDRERTTEMERLRLDTATREERDRQALNREQTRADETQRRLTEMERDHAEMVRALREINDRFIRYRAGGSAGSADEVRAQDENAGMHRRTHSAARHAASPRRAEPVQPIPPEHKPEDPAAEKRAGPRIRLTR